MKATISRICRYPVKGLSPDDMTAASLVPAEALANDRRFALALGSTRFDGGSPHWLPKSSFLELMKNEKLATLDTRYDDATDELVIFRDGKQVKRGKLTDPMGRALIEDFFSAYMKEETRGQPHVVEAKGDVTFSDVNSKVLSIINLASVHDLERVAGIELDPIRFRGNIYIEGLEPWAEFQWLGKKIGAGDAILKVTKRIDRCAAINVDPATGARGINLLKDLKRGFGHIDMGVYAVVEEGGSISVGDTIGVID